MKIETPEVEMVVSKKGDSHSFDIDPAMKGHLINILRNSIYSDPALAVIREYFSNAVDEHLKLNIPISKIEVGIPGTFCSDFIIRDYGSGLDEDDVRNLLRFYGSSTKRNDNSAIGGFGVGFKSAFSYTESFTINTFKNGRKLTFFVTKAISDEDTFGCGSINKVSDVETTEPDGVEVVVPIKHSDVRSFAEKVRNYMANTKYYFGQLPVFFTSGATERKPIDFSVNTLEPIKKHGNVAMLSTAGYSYNNPSYINIKGVAYSVDTSKIEEFFKHNPYRYMYGRYYIISAEIGDIDISVSRETPQFTPKTMAFIKASSEKYHDELIATVNAEMDKLTTSLEWEHFLNSSRGFDGIEKLAATRPNFKTFAKVRGDYTRPFLSIKGNGKIGRMTLDSKTTEEWPVIVRCEKRTAMFNRYIEILRSKYKNNVFFIILEGKDENDEFDNDLINAGYDTNFVFTYDEIVKKYKSDLPKRVVTATGGKRVANEINVTYVRHGSDNSARYTNVAALDAALANHGKFMFKVYGTAEEINTLSSAHYTGGCSLVYNGWNALIYRTVFIKVYSDVSVTTLSKNKDYMSVAQFETHFNKLTNGIVYVDYSAISRINNIKHIGKEVNDIVDALVKMQGKYNAVYNGAKCNTYDYRIITSFMNNTQDIEVNGKKYNLSKINDVVHEYIDAAIRLASAKETYLSPNLAKEVCDACDSYYIKKFTEIGK